MSTTHKQINEVSALAANGDVDKTVIAAQGAGTKLKLRTVTITIIAAETGDGGIAALEDGVGGKKLFVVSGETAGSSHFHDFGDDGPILSDNTLLNLTVEGAATTQASARATVSCKVLGA